MEETVQQNAVRITVATRDDLEAIIALIGPAHGESRYAAYPFAQVRLRRYATQLLNDVEGK